MQLKEVIQKTTQFFRDKGYQSPRLDTELLLASALQWERMKLYTNYDYPLTDKELTDCRELVRRRASGEPVAYILGKKDFYNHSFNVNSAVLIPRPETESIVEAVIKWVQAQPDLSEPRIVDLGTGSGCIGLSLLAEIKEAKLLALDISDGALAIAQQNAEILEVKERVQTLCQEAEKLSADDVQTRFGQLADVVVSNPPYIAEDDPDIEANVRKWEPHQALFAERHGLACIEAWAKTAARIARPGAFVMFEIGFDQGLAAKRIFEQVDAFTEIEIARDLASHERFIRCLKRKS